MAKEVLDRAVEPFYTTKDVGKGSGLGLSMVHGFVHQSGGAMTITSEENIGTTISLYLPLLEDIKEVESAAPPDNAAHYQWERAKYPSGRGRPGSENPVHDLP